MPPNLDRYECDEDVQRRRRGRTPMPQRVAALLALGVILSLILALPIAYAANGDWSLMIWAVSPFGLVSVPVIVSDRRAGSRSTTGTRR